MSRDQTVETEVGLPAMFFSKVLLNFWSSVDCSHFWRCSLISNENLYGCIKEDLERQIRKLFCLLFNCNLPQIVISYL